MDEISHEFLRAFRKTVKAVNPNAIILGEAWHEPGVWLRGDQLDAVMNYGITKALMDIDQCSDLATDGPYGYGPDVWYQTNDILMKYATKRHLLLLPVYGLESWDMLTGLMARWLSR